MGFPHHLQTESPPHIHFLCCSKLTKNSLYKFICTTDLHDLKIWLFAPHHLSVQKVQMSLITQNCVQVSPPPAKKIKTLSLFTEQLMTFVGPHHGPKILGKNHQSTTKVTLNEPPIKRRVNSCARTSSPRKFLILTSIFTSSVLYSSG